MTLFEAFVRGCGVASKGEEGKRSKSGYLCLDLVSAWRIAGKEEAGRWIRFTVEFSKMGWSRETRVNSRRSKKDLLGFCTGRYMRSMQNDRLFCKEIFKLRPTLVKNIMLEALTEQLKMIAIRAAPTDQSHAGLNDTACDICPGRGLKAIKSCLMCLLSYCENHLQPHYDVARLKKHQLVDPSFQFHENICSHHDEVMKMFCRTDQQSICYVCTVDEHKGHDIVSGEAERMEKQKKLEVRREDIQQKIKEREKDFKLLQQEMEAIIVSAEKAVQVNKSIFTEVIYLLQQRSFELSQQIRSQQDFEVSRVKDLQEKLEQEICELKKKDFELQHLLQTEDHNHFFLNFSSLSSLSEPDYSSTINVCHPRYFKDVIAAVSELGDKFQDTLRRKWADISLRVTEVDVLLSEPEPDPKKRSGFLKFTNKISRDPKTSHKQLLLDEGNRRITLMSQTSPDHPERFSVPFQILSRQSLTGRCYWEVKLGGLGGYVAVAYKEVYKADTEFGANDKSWALFCSLNKNIFLHNKIQTLIPGSKFSRIGVYVNQRAGTLSFYNVSENMTLLHRVQTTFTQPLYAGIRMYCKFGDTAEICKLK